MSPAQVVSSPVAKPFQKRAWVVFVIGMSAIVLLLSGIVLFIAPSGRIARVTEWTLVWLDKEAWVNLHNLFAILFVGGLIWHLVFNWKPLRGYIVNRAAHRLNLKAEMLAAAAVVLVLIVLVAQNLPPAPALTHLSDYFRQQFWK